MATPIERSLQRATLVAVFFAGAAAALVGVLALIFASDGLPAHGGAVFQGSDDDLLVVRAPPDHTAHDVAAERGCSVASINGDAALDDTPVRPGDRITLDCEPAPALAAPTP
jgi:hypothetical protein